jgi:Tfp pilus assembly protein PilW
MHSPNPKRGITFIESLIWIAVFMISMMAIIVSLLSFYRANTYTLEQAQAVSDARRSTEHLVATLREADYASDGAYPIVSMGTSTITFYANIDKDNLIERVRYAVTGTTLVRGITKPSGTPLGYTGTESVSVVSPYIRNITQHVDALTYYDSTGAVITDMNNVSSVRFVTVKMIVNVEPNRLPNELTLWSSATLRNLR